MSSAVELRLTLPFVDLNTWASGVRPRCFIERSGMNQNHFSCCISLVYTILTVNGEIEKQATVQTKV